MSEDEPARSPIDRLRRRAERRLRPVPLRVGLPHPAEVDLEQLVRDLLAYQAELQAENDELAKAWDDARAIAERYRDLFDLAPFGYFRLDPGGRVRQANLAGASLLGIASADLVGRPLSLFVAPSSLRAFAAFLVDVRDRGRSSSSDVSLARRGGPASPVHLAGATIGSTDESRIAMLDAADRREGGTGDDGYDA